MYPDPLTPVPLAPAEIKKNYFHIGVVVTRLALGPMVWVPVENQLAFQASFDEITLIEVDTRVD